MFNIGSMFSALNSVLGRELTNFVVNSGVNVLREGEQKNRDILDKMQEEIRNIKR